MQRTPTLIPVVLAVVLSAGCATTGARAERGGHNVLTRAEVEETMQITAFEAVRHARPGWLRVRGPNSITSMNPIMVYVDGARSGGLEALRSIPVMVVERIRFYDGSEAQARFGLNHTNGAIEVITRTR